jgi:cell division protein FtsQ
MRLVGRVWAMTILVGLVAAGWAGYLWVRDLSLLRVRNVEVEGAAGRDSGTIRRALTQTGERMTVLHVREDELERAVDSIPVVRSISASVDFPSTLRVKVTRHTPVAELLTGSGRRVAVAEEGTLLPRLTERKLPAVSVDSIPTGGKLEKAAPRTLVRVLSHAPVELRPLLERAYATGEGIRVAVRGGPALYFGDARRPAAKWAAATRVLADETSKGAAFVDVRLPERPATGGFSGSTGSEPEAP